MSASELRFGSRAPLAAQRKRTFSLVRRLADQQCRQRAETRRSFPRGRTRLDDSYVRETARSGQGRYRPQPLLSNRRRRPNEGPQRVDASRQRRRTGSGASPRIDFVYWTISPPSKAAPKLALAFDTLQIRLPKVLAAGCDHRGVESAISSLVRRRARRAPVIHISTSPCNGSWTETHRTREHVDRHQPVDGRAS